MIELSLRNVMKGISQFMSEIDAVLYEQYQSIHVIYTDLFCFQASTALCILCHLCLQLNKKCCASEHHLNPVRLLTGGPAVTDRGEDGPDCHWGNLSMRGSWLQRQPNTLSITPKICSNCEGVEDIRFDGLQGSLPSNTSSRNGFHKKMVYFG